MVAGQKMVAPDGYEVCLFPLPYMYISQGENGSISHEGTLNIDFIGWSANGRVYDAPVYAPCSCRCTRILDTNNNGRVFESLNKVHCADGTLRYINWIFFHDENPIASPGDTFNQGDIIYHTGTAGNVTGDHVHMNFANGTYTGWTYSEPYHRGMLINSAHIYNICYVNDTVLVYDEGYPWVTYNGETIESLKKSKFPWVLYARKLRGNY